MQQVAGPRPEEITNAMKAFIIKQGKAKVKEITDHAERDFTYGKDKMVDEEKTRLSEKLEKDLQIAEINTKIERSAALNKVRIQKMRKINEMVESLQFQAKVKMNANLTKDKKAYQKLVRDLLV